MNEPQLSSGKHSITFFFGGEPVSHILQEPVVTLGRSRENMIWIQNPSVSKFHLVFYQQADGSYEMTDLGSCNGTAVNGNAVSSHQLRDGDGIVIGRVVTAQYQIERSRPMVPGDSESLALVKSQVPTFENLCERAAPESEENLALPS